MGARKYFLDWLRVIAFGLLIVFHVGMLYVPWHYNLKSPRILPALEWPMLALLPWRLPLLFLVSGVASRFLLTKLGAGAFARDRLRRLLPVILFGMFVVIPPQTWIELVDKGVTHQSYLNFWLFSYLPADQRMVRPLGKTMPTWDHLWYLVYLLAYTLVFAAVAKLTGLAARTRDAARAVPVWLAVAAPGVWLIATTMIVERLAPRTDAFFDDWASHLKWIGMFVVGTALAAREDFWIFIRERRRLLAWSSLGLLLVVFASHALWLAGKEPPPSDWLLWGFTTGPYAWAMVLTVCGYASYWLDRPTALLSYLNEAILPIYVLHQPILLLAAYVVFRWQLPLPIEASILMLITALGLIALYQLLIRPFAPMRFLFGVKQKDTSTAPPSKRWGRRRSMGSAEMKRPAH